MQLARTQHCRGAVQEQSRSPRAAARPGAVQRATPACGLRLQLQQWHAAPSSGVCRLAPAAALPVEAPAALAEAHAALNPVFEVAEGLETPIQLMYLLTLLGFLAGGAFLVVRQVLIRRELDEAAKALGERIRTGEATCEDYYELGVILTRKKLYTQATKNLEKAKKVWDGDESELAQVHNALGYCYFQMDRADMAIAEYKLAVSLQPGYVTAWNNLGDAHEKQKQWRDALASYQEVLSYAPTNEVALQRSTACRQKIERMSTTSL